MGKITSQEILRKQGSLRNHPSPYLPTPTRVGRINHGDLSPKGPLCGVVSGGIVTKGVCAGPRMRPDRLTFGGGARGVPQSDTSRPEPIPLEDPCSASEFTLLDPIT